MTRHRLVVVLLVSMVALSMGTGVIAHPSDPSADNWSSDRGDASHTGSNAGAAPTGPNATIAWQRGTSNDQGPGGPFTPAIANGTAYVAYDDTGSAPTYESKGHVIAYNASTGDVQWNQSAVPGPSEAPSVANGRVFLTSTGDSEIVDTDPPDQVGGVYALNASTGEIVWARNDSLLRNADAHVVAAERVYVEIEVGGSATSDRLYALDAATGETVWNTTLDVNGSSAPSAFDIAYVDDTLVVRQWYFRQPNETIVRAIDADSGANRWITTVTATESPTSGDVPQYAGDLAENPPEVALTDTTAYLTIGTSELYALSLANGTVRWNTSLSASFEGSTPEWASAPAVSHGRVFVSTMDTDSAATEHISTVHAVNASTGSTVWRFQTAARVAAPTVANDSVYVGGFFQSVEGARTASPPQAGVFALNATSGTERWNFALQEPAHRTAISTAPAEGALYVRTASLETYSNSGTITVLESTSGPVAPVHRFANDSVSVDDEESPENMPPTVTIETDPANATSVDLEGGTTVTLTANASDPDGNVTAIEWDIGDDGTVDMTGESISLQLDVCGSLSLRVQVTDEAGATTTETVTLSTT